MESKTGIVLLLVLCTAWQAQAAYNCTSAGRFADPDDTTCKNYTLCVYDSSSSSYIAYDYECPTTSLFNPDTSLCTSSDNYVCNVTSSNTTSNSSSVCTEDGFVADPSSTDCTSYIQCVEINSTFTETTYTCPNGSYFDPNTTLCDSNYTCSSNSTTPSSFSCTSAGRFANTEDTTCQTYYYCVLNTDGTYLQYDYTCPTTSVFSPAQAQCTTNYTCTTS